MNIFKSIREFYKVKTDILLIIIPLTVLVILLFGYAGYFISTILLIPCIYIALSKINNPIYKVLYFISIITIYAISYWVDTRQTYYFIINNKDLLIGLAVQLIVLMLIIFLFKYNFRQKTVGTKSQLIILIIFITPILFIADIFASVFLYDSMYITQGCGKTIDNLKAVYVNEAVDPKSPSIMHGIVYKHTSFLMFQKIELNTTLKASDFCENSPG